MNTSGRSSRKALVVFVLVLLIISSIFVVLNGASDQGTQVKSSTSSEVISTSPITGQGFSGQQVNPFLSYSYEPAPMGIADYGIGYSGMAYSYTTNSFMGIINITSLSTYNSTQNSYNMSFQLNLNMNFTYSGLLYDYWIQDVAFLNTSNDQVTFVDNIWNLSSPRAVIYNSTLYGNGTVGLSSSGTFYYDVANESLPGNNQVLTEPTTIYLKAITFLNSQGSPQVNFLYDDGTDWVLYDSAVFQFASALTQPSHFLVDGFNYNPCGTYYDAELIMGGPGNSSQTMDLSSSVSLVLQYYNGHNYQTIQNAFNFGSDTAETIYNVQSVGMYYVDDGQLFANISTGPGILDSLYFDNQISSLEVLTTIESGDLYVNGTEITSFSGNLVNITLFPGTYSIALYDNSSDMMLSLGNVTLTAGQYTELRQSLYQVKFDESGLPSGTSWYVNGSGFSSGPINGDQYSINLPNGTYNFTIYANNDEYYPINRSGNFGLNGSSLQINITFAPVLYTVTFLETGLPDGTSWSVTMNGGGSAGSTNNTIIFQVTNGTYNFVILRTGNYKPSNPTGSVSVDGKSVIEKVSFNVSDGFLFGSISPSEVTVLINGTEYNVTNGLINISLQPGNYSLEISASGYMTYFANITILPSAGTQLPLSSLAREGGTSNLVVDGIVFSFLMIVAFVAIIRARRR